MPGGGYLFGCDPTGGTCTPLTVGMTVLVVWVLVAVCCCCVAAINRNRISRQAQHHAPLLTHRPLSGVQAGPQAGPQAGVQLPYQQVPAQAQQHTIDAQQRELAAQYQTNAAQQQELTELRQQAEGLLARESRRPQAPVAAAAPAPAPAEALDITAEVPLEDPATPAAGRVQGSE